MSDGSNVRNIGMCIAILIILIIILINYNFTKLQIVFDGLDNIKVDV
jgi:hypothetical protein